MRLAVYICALSSRTIAGLLAILGIGALQTDNMTRPIVVEKYFYPAHQACLSFDVAGGEGMVEYDKSSKVYLVRSESGWVDDQWILKLDGVDRNGRPMETFMLVPFETWVANHPGKPFGGVFLMQEVRWM